MVTGRKAKGSEDKFSRIHIGIWILVLFLPHFIQARLPHSIQARNYYVSPTGNDANPGTITQPWRTISRVNAFDVSPHFQPGDNIYFEGSKSFSGHLEFYNTSGTATNPITIGSYGNGKATINAGSTGSGIAIYQIGGYNINNLIVTGTVEPTKYDGIILNDYLTDGTIFNHIYIDNVDVHGFSQFGIGIIGWTQGSGGYRDVRITNCNVYNNVLGGLVVEDWSTYPRGNKNPNFVKTLYIGDVISHNNPGDSTGATGHGILIDNVQDATIERCTVYNNAALGGSTLDGGTQGISAYDSDNVTMQYNESYENKCRLAGDASGFDLDEGVTNSRVQYNYTHGNNGPAILITGISTNPNHDNTIRYNISENDNLIDYAEGAISVGGNDQVSTWNEEIYNNTIYMTPGKGDQTAALLTWFSGSNVHFRNNLIVTTGGEPLVNVQSAGSGLLFQGNDYWPSGGAFSINYNGTNYGSLSAWRKATGQEMNGASPTGKSVDPRLNNAGGGGTIGNADLLNTLSAYQLQPGSPMINTGLNLLSLFGVNPGSVDYYGFSIPQGAGYDIGAHTRVKGH